MKRIRRIEVVPVEDFAAEMANNIIDTLDNVGDLGWMDFFYDHYKVDDRVNFKNVITSVIIRELKQVEGV